MILPFGFLSSVCQKFLQTYPEEQKRLWEVEAPGDWSQRVNIWLKIQMESSPSGSELNSVNLATLVI